MEQYHWILTAALCTSGVPLRPLRADVAKCRQTEAFDFCDCSYVYNGISGYPDQACVERESGGRSRREAGQRGKRALLAGWAHENMICRELTCKNPRLLDGDGETIGGYGHACALCVEQSHQSEARGRRR